MIGESPERRLTAQYAGLRRRAPLVWSPKAGAWLATTPGAVREAFADRDLLHPFTAARPVPADPEAAAFLESWRAFNRGPAQDVLHARTARHLSAAGVARHRDALATEMDAITGAAALQQGPDLVRHIARPAALASLELCLGLPRGQLRTRSRLVAGIGRLIENPGWPRGGAARGRLREAAALFQGEGLATEGLARALLSHERDADATGLFLLSLLRVASGLEALMAAALLDLLVEPGLARGVASGEVDAVAAAREVLRLHSPVQAVLRGLPAGGDTRPPLLLLVGSANRDPDWFREPDRYDPHRPAVAQLSFGHGLHRCPASHFVVLTLVGLLTASAPFLQRCRVSPSGLRWRRGRWTLHLSRLLVDTRP